MWRHRAASLTRRVQVFGAFVLHELFIARLRVEAWLADLRGGPGPPRVVATACWAFPIYSQTFVHQEVLSLAQAGFSVRLLYSHRGPRAELAHSCANLWRLKRLVLLSQPTGAADFDRFRRRMPAKVQAITQLIAAASGLRADELERHEHFLHAFSFARAVEAWRADYIHSYFFYERTLFALVASHLLELPRGVSCYADHVLQDYPLKLVPLHLKTCDVIVATSQRIRAELEVLHGAPLQPVVVKPNGIDMSSFPVKSLPDRRPADRIRLLSVSRIDPKKGIEYLVEAVQDLMARGVDVEAQVMGAPDNHLPESLIYWDWLKAQVIDRDLNRSIHFTGRQNSREVRSALERTHVFVAPFVELPNGDKDGIPTAVLEAMAAGCAIVATNAGSIGEVIEDGREGLIVPQRDPGALADAIERLARDAQLATRLGVAAAIRARRQFDVATTEAVFHRRVHDAIKGRQRELVPTEAHS
jgi:colanic acid/amylovoran biosynthesis glycosyltransferase